jgi:hypothetical protein
MRAVDTPGDDALHRRANFAEKNLIGGKIDRLFDQAFSESTDVNAGKIRAQTKSPSSESMP